MPPSRKVSTLCQWWRGLPPRENSALCAFFPNHSPGIPDSIHEATSLNLNHYSELMKYPLLPALALATAALLLPARADQAPEKFETLTTSKNKNYKDVIIREVTPSGVKIMHESGTATIPYQDLPADVQKKLGGFDPAAAERHRQQVAENLQKQESAIDEGLRNMPQPKPAPPALAAKNPPPLEMPVPQAGLPGGMDLDGGFTLPGEPALVPPARQAPPKAPAPAPGAKAPAPDRGQLSARVTGYPGGYKKVEFKALTNCRARLEVHNVIPGEQSEFTIERGVPFSREINVYNQWSADLTSEGGQKLDREEWNKKTDTFQKTTLDGATLR